MEILQGVGKTENPVRYASIIATLVADWSMVEPVTTTFDGVDISQ
jgi:hypothetical protein